MQLKTLIKGQKEILRDLVERRKALIRENEELEQLVEKRTREFQHDGQKFQASDDEPYWIVESEKTGATAAHKESSLTRA